MAFMLGSKLTSNIPLTQYLSETASYFRVIEIPTDPRFLSPHFLLNHLSQKTLRTYREEYRFRYTMHAPFVNLGALDYEERSVAVGKFKSALQVAGDLEIPLMTFHPTMVLPENLPQYQECCKYEAANIAALLNEAEELGITLAIENMPSTPEYHRDAMDGKRIAELLSFFPTANFGVTVDIGHALQAQINLENLLSLDRIRHFHFHENDRLTDRHLRIISNLNWWETLLQKLKEKFPQAVGILEMNQLVDQMDSFERLNPFL